MGRAIDIVKVKAEIAAGKLAAIAENGNVLLKDMQSGEAVKIATLPQPSNEPLTEWVSVEERLPENSECWETYIVIVNRSHWPTSSYDPCDAPYDETLVSTAKYDSKQKIWHIDWDEQLNALIDIENAPLNGDYVTHWMPLPAPPDKDNNVLAKTPNEPLTLEHLRASPHGKIKDSTLQSICNRANEIACRPPEGEE